MQIRKFYSLIILSLLVSINGISYAQCAMCKGTVQTSDYARSINNGILYMLLVPIVLGGILIFLWLKNKNKFHVNE
jgi:hypothetical protein